ncbi:uncharacterized protein MELLADRAFT_90015 [Melampsora larici-populina 98AG31]|uniref:CxC1-like cysteine cluster associated with KDZ transposases domain-containing protein n=1 Tax=Melampsora larici-populina (strain 98AG31 / pathotype 3-4-7) TaxID=747676 RepID=F4RVF3_MELLP|nr:uncharacterized protein MELLADRAFT_90015 [Melampsora larici-populina 98AG31]EGG03615.1 hypothetical protein MELLADRAFT_90015 [Melampsora larici-populina 98AG31]
MVSHRVIFGLTTRRRQPRAVTPRQLEFIRQQARDLRNSERAIANLQQRLATRERFHPPTPGLDPRELPLHLPNPAGFDDPPEAEPNENPANYVINPIQFMPPIPNQTVDPVLAALRKEQRLGERLVHETRWAWQYAIMLPTFLRCRLATSNWGNCELWNHDFRNPCNCKGRTERDVDLVDLLYRRRVKISFCKTCDPSDLVRLLLMGYIGASPKCPETAFSVRLMVHHHKMWLRCAVPTKDWREPFTAAIDAYRAILLQIRTLENQKLALSDLGILANNCPKCFGPPVGVTRAEEPDLVICIDGNFQHRRHAAASVEIPGAQPPRPSMFLDPAAVDDMACKINRTKPKAGIECTEAHTTANDARGKSYFQAMDDSGLIGMACRHDHVLQYINMIQSGEKIHYPLALIKWLLEVLDNSRDHSNKVEILYDIGCNLDKSTKMVRNG